MYTYLSLTSDQGVATVTLARPDVYNALNDDLTFELQAVLKEIRKDESIRVLVITGEGKAFCSGQDLKSSQNEENRSFIDSLKKRYNPIIRSIRQLPIPVICRLNGVAAGAGCSLALACDLIIASQNASLIEVFINIGLVPDSGSTWFLPRAVGTMKAFELATMGSKISAGEALQLGFVNKVVPNDQLDSTVKEYTDHYSQAPTRAIGLIKKMLQKSAHSTLDEMLDYEAYCQQIAGTTGDYKEGVAAFREKRPPKFTGK